MAAKVKKAKETPLMKQYAEIKSAYPGAILLFRVGDFYETFGEDAVKASGILDIVLTKRSNGSASEVELAGFPHHALDTYLPKLVRAGERVAICDQLEDPKMVKGIVKRGVTELITPGVSANDKTFDAKRNNYVAALFEQQKRYGLALADLSTGEFMVAEGGLDYIERILRALQPSEVLVPKSYKEGFGRSFGDAFYHYALDNWFFEASFAREQLLVQFKVDTLRGFGIEDLDLAVIAAGSVVHYLNQTHHTDLDHLHSIRRIDEDTHVWIDSFTLRNLEVLRSNHPNGIALLDVMDRTLTPMGSRMLKRWMVLPLLDRQQIESRLDVVEYLLADTGFQQSLEAELKLIGDLERLISKVSLRRVNPRELLQLASALEAMERIKEQASRLECRPLDNLIAKLGNGSEVARLIRDQLKEDAPVAVQKGGVFKSGISAELDEYNDISRNGKAVLLRIKDEEAERTGISSLKLAFNNVFGYYLEVKNTHKDKVPESWIRKQTLVNAERYITPELKEFEEKILGAEDRIQEIELALYDALLHQLGSYILSVQSDARNLSTLDCLSCFARISKANDYHRPKITEDSGLAIKDGRHPVIEQQLAFGEPYIPNDIYLNPEDQQIIILTGPNMSGKSAILRQTALTVLMAQVGCFVPARHAQIGIVDKIYTRVGASDNISQGESTFMVEMVETASILNNLSERSLIILDEIGRGTSTFDGVSLAWSIAEFLSTSELRPKTLFATHYHELNELESKYPGIVNYHVSTEEAGNKVIFLRKMKKGGSEHSFGIHVAQMAGIPRKVTRRAAQILAQLEQDRASISGKKQLKKLEPERVQLQLFQLNDPKLKELLNELSNLDVDRLTPIEALMKLHELRQILED